MSSLPIFPHFNASWTNIGPYSVGAVSALLLSAYLYLWTYRNATLSYKNIPGPPTEHWFWGNMTKIIKSAPLERHMFWAKEYGRTFRYQVLFGDQRFFTTDPVALSYILQHGDMFPKPEQTRKAMADMLGDGLLTAEGETHRRQRKVLQPSFSPGAIKDMVPIFYDKSYELRDKLQGLIDDQTLEASPTPPKPEDEVPGGRKIDVMKFLGMATIDVIGTAGFNYEFKALQQPKNELAEAFRNMFSAGQELSLMGIIQFLVPGAKYIPTKRQQTIKASQEVTQRIGRQLIAEKKKAIQAAHAGGLEKGHDIGKDLLSLCIRANMASDTKPDQRMTDEEVLAQITTFMLAGNETSSTALTWILYQLSLHPEAQARLRKEAFSVEDDRPNLETLNSLPYMEAVVREVLRILPPATSTIREAGTDVILPLGTPVKGRDGKMISSVKLSKGTTLFIPIMALNTDEAIWGPDASEFNPDRFATLASDPTQSEKQNQIPGVWGNLLTFLGGTRNCIGYRFALAEIKAMLFVLIRNFEFEELKSKPVIEKKSSIVMRSRVATEPEAGLQMPLMVKPVATN